MKIALIFPPVADATQPYSSLPALAGFLVSRGRHEPVLHDANLEFFRSVLTRESIVKASSTIERNLRALSGSRRQRLNKREHYGQLVGASLKAPIVAGLIDQAVIDLKTVETFRDMSRLDRAKRVMSDAIDVLSAASLPLSLRASDIGHACSSAIEISRLAKDSNCNPFFAFLKDVTLPFLEFANPGAVGISITYRSQIPAAVTLALLVKRNIPGMHIIFGGHIATSWYDVLDHCPEIFEWCDYLIAYEGETALDALLSALEHAGNNIGTVPNLAYAERGHVRKNSILIEDIDALPTPDYSGLPLDLYFAPKPVLLVNTSRGCYWGKCEFCSVSPSMRGMFRMRSPHLITQDISLLQARHSVECIFFGDDCVPPRALQALARDLIASGVKVSWQCEVRFEPQLTGPLIEEIERAGCRNLIFGLESSVPRVLALMKKGIYHGEINRILNDCRSHGIAFNLQLFFGFPGETTEEARQTMDFVVAQLHGAATVSYGAFKLQRHSGVAEHPEAFNVQVKDRPSSLDNEFAYDPAPFYTGKVIRKLRKQILRRARYRTLPLSIDAHTLLYLHESGVAATADRYYNPKPAVRNIPTLAGHARLVAKPGQTIGEFQARERGKPGRILLYDYDLDQTVEVSPLAARIVADRLDQPTSLSEIVDDLVAEAGDPGMRPQLETTVGQIFQGLLERGMVEAMD